MLSADKLLTTNTEVCEYAEHNGITQVGCLLGQAAHILKPTFSLVYKCLMTHLEMLTCNSFECT